MSADLSLYFPTQADIPTQWRLTAPIEQRDYLLNGELCQWQGDLAPVYSPVALRNSAGELTPTLLGATPLMDETAPKLRWMQP